MKPSRNVPATFKPLTFTLDWCSSESIRHNPPQLEVFSVQEHGADIFFPLILSIFPFKTVNTGFNGRKCKKCRGKTSFYEQLLFC